MKEINIKCREGASSNIGGARIKKGFDWALKERKHVGPWRE